MKKYYHAYNERYKKIHQEGLLWFSNKPTPEVINWVDYHYISLGENLCEIGCGEGRDALFLAKKGFNITAVDIAEEAIRKCRVLSAAKGLKIAWVVSDALQLGEKLSNNYNWIYSVGTLHMLVKDEDRRGFLNSIYSLLKPGGKFLLVNMGDGDSERSTDLSTAFELQERGHMGTGRKFEVAGTSYRAVNWDNHIKELTDAGFVIDKMFNTENRDYSKCMTVYLNKEEK